MLKRKVVLYKVITLIIFLFYVVYCFKIQSVKGYPVGDEEFLNPFLFTENTVENPDFNRFVDPYFEKNSDFREVYITSIELQEIKNKKMVQVFIYLLPLILVISILYFKNLKNEKKNEENSV